MLDLLNNHINLENILDHAYLQQYLLLGTI